MLKIPSLMSATANSEPPFVGSSISTVLISAAALLRKHQLAL